MGQQAIGSVAHGRERRGLGPLVGSTIADVPGPRDVRRREALYRRALATADAAAVVAALLLSVVAVGGKSLPALALLAVPLVIVASKLAGLYDRDELLIRKTATLDEVPALLNVATLLALLFAIAVGSGFEVGLAGPTLLTLWVSLLILLVLLRGAARRLALRRTPAERCLVVGDADACSQMRKKLSEGSHTNSCVLGYLPLRNRVRVGDAEPLAGLPELEHVVRSRNVHRVIVAPRGSDTDVSLEAVRRAKAVGVQVSVLPRIFEVVGSSAAFDDVGGVTLLGVARFGLTRSSALAKRALDLGGSLAGLLAMAPLLALAAAAIRLDSRGPVFFRQPRVGREGQVFQIVKFRTMAVGAEALRVQVSALNETEGLFKAALDPRVTRVGRWLRRSSFDELPQLINVLRGEMSLVGPRPLVLEEDRRIEGWERRRLHIKPGMTGPWQILGSARVPLHEMVKIDYLYVGNWSLWGDIRILLRTFLYALSRRNA